jgi:hypothetical protein
MSVSSSNGKALRFIGPHQAGETMTAVARRCAANYSRIQSSLLLRRFNVTAVISEISDYALPTTRAPAAHNKSKD